MPHLAVIALGSNLGDRLAHLQRAFSALQTIAMPGTWRQSSIYQTEPVACPDDSPDFFNAVVSFTFDGNAAGLHAHTRAIEQSLGRERSTTNAPRTIDLDLLAFGREIIDTPDLQIPHPRLHLRRFVLEPLAEIHPDLVLPTQKFSIITLLERLDCQEPPLRRVTTANE
jgi:2-amino-4-hydroxy-6-hydroxymethyldihydropteridine diphosphokinase